MQIASYKNQLELIFEKMETEIRFQVTLSECLGISQVLVQYTTFLHYSLRTCAFKRRQLIVAYILKFK